MSDNTVANEKKSRLNGSMLKQITPATRSKMRPKPSPTLDLHLSSPGCATGR